MSTPIFIFLFLDFFFFMLYKYQQTQNRRGQMHLSPAECVVELFGGVRATARAIGRNPGAVSRWNKPKSKRGTGGMVPSAAQRIILKIAKKKRLKITLEHLNYGKIVNK